MLNCSRPRSAGGVWLLRRIASGGATLATLGLVSAMAVATPAIAQDAPAAGDADRPSLEPVPEEAVRERGDRNRQAPPGAGRRGRGDRPEGAGSERGEGPRRRLSPEQIEQVIEVAREVFPDWASRLEELRSADPEAIDRALANNARRLFALAMLRDRNPELYAMKVEELRNQMELRRLSEKLREAAAAGKADEAAGIRKQIRILATRHVDLGLRTRAMELSAMDEAIRRMRIELEEESLARDAAIDTLVEAVEAGRPLEPIDRPPGRGDGAVGRLSRPDDAGGPPRRPRPSPPAGLPPSANED